jgi:hypothetical protein
VKTDKPVLLLAGIAVALVITIVVVASSSRPTGPPAQFTAAARAPLSAPLSNAAPATEAQPATAAPVEAQAANPPPALTQPMAVVWTEKQGAALMDTGSWKFAPISQVEASLRTAGAKRVDEFKEEKGFIYAAYKYLFPDGSYLWIEYEDDIASTTRGTDVRLSRFWEPNLDYRTDQ